MSRKTKYLWIVAASLWCITGTVQAETWDEKVDRHFSLLDIDGDGSISRNEAGTHPPLTQHFRAMDKNKDGGISKVELVTYRATPARNRSLAKASTVIRSHNSPTSAE